MVKDPEKNKINESLGTLLIRTIASKNDSKINFPDKDNLTENMVLDLEYSVLIPVKKNEKELTHITSPPDL